MVKQEDLRLPLRAVLRQCWPTGLKRSPAPSNRPCKKRRPLREAKCDLHRRPKHTHISDSELSRCCRITSKMTFKPPSAGCW